MWRFLPWQTNLAKVNKLRRQRKPPPRVVPGDCWQNLVPRRRRPGWELQLPSPPRVSCWETKWQKISTPVKRSAAFCCPLEHSPPGAHSEPASNVCSLPMTHPRQKELRAAGSLANKHLLVCTDCWGDSPTCSLNPAGTKWDKSPRPSTNKGSLKGVVAHVSGWVSVDQGEMPSHPVETFFLFSVTLRTTFSPITAAGLSPLHQSPWRQALIPNLLLAHSAWVRARCPPPTPL